MLPTQPNLRGDPVRTAAPDAASEPRPGTAAGPELRRLFCIDSYGATATAWLAACLNEIPGVVCAHSFFWPPSCPTFAEPEAGNEELWMRERLSDPDDLFSRLLADHPGARCLGTVHAFPIGTAERWSGAAPLRVVYLLRHPVLQIDSLTQHWIDRCATDADFLERTLARLREHAAESVLAQLAGPELLGQLVDGHGSRRPGAEGAIDPEARLADLLWLACAIEIVDSHARAFARPDVPIFTMERICTDAADLEVLLGYVTAGTIEDLAPAIQRGLSSGPVNRHRRAPRQPEVVLAGWHPARRAVWTALIASPLGERYRRLGYQAGTSHGLASQLRSV